jgi:uncharacterized protein YdaT
MANKKATPKKTSSTRARSSVTGKFVAIKNSMSSYVVSGTTVHVIPRSKNSWAVVSEGTSRASKIHKDKKSAVTHGKEIARKRSGNVVIHKKDGSFAKRIKPQTSKETSKKTGKRK